MEDIHDVRVRIERTTALIEAQKQGCLADEHDLAQLVGARPETASWPTVRAWETKVAGARERLGKRGANLHALEEELKNLQQTAARLMRQEQKDLERERAKEARFEQSELNRLSHDDANYWFRRLMLQPQLGNGAAFLAVAGGVLQADNIAAAAALAKEPFSWFATGLAVSGVPPFFLWASRLEPKRVKLFERAAFYTTLLAGAFFFVGLWDAVMVMRHVKSPFAEEMKAVAPASPPSVPATKPQISAPTRDTSAPPEEGSKSHGDAPLPATSRKGSNV